MHRKLTKTSQEDVLEENSQNKEEESSTQEAEETDQDEDEEHEEHEEESHHSEEGLEDPVNGPMIDSALIPTQAMLASANPYLNPMHPLHPFKHEFNVKHHYNTPHGMVTYSNGSSDHGSSGGMGGMGMGMGGMNLAGDDLASFDKMMGLPNEIYPDGCSKVQNEAMKIANKLMKDYNKRVFRKIMTYLLKSKFLIGMTEIKLNHIMRKKISNVMNSFSKVSGGNIEFVHSSQEPVLSDEDDSMDSDVQDIDFSGFSDSQVEKGSDTEMFNNLDTQMGTQGNVHLDD